MKYLSDYSEAAQSELFKKTGSFFAFSKSQFDEASKPDVKYTSVGYGLICPSENVDELLKSLDEINAIAVKLDVEENGAEAIIRREYFNHETQISSDRTAAIDALDSHREIYPELFTDEIIRQVMNDCWKQAVENDWF
jgi:hypothetical protein